MSIDMDAIDRAAPGRLKFGDTFVVKGVRDSVNFEAVVSFEVFGSHIEVDIRRDSGTLSPTIDYKQRDLGPEQEKFVKAMAMFFAGVSLGWFPKQVRPYQPDELQQ